MKTLTEGLKALTVETEQKEILAVGRKPIKLQYLKRSKECGLRMWNCLTPVEGYKTGPDMGFPTFSLQTLIDKGLI